MAYWVIETMANAANAGPGGVMRRVRKVAGSFASKAEADQRRAEFARHTKETYERRDLPSDVRRQALETNYAVWSDEYIEEARRAGVQV